LHILHQHSFGNYLLEMAPRRKRQRLSEDGAEAVTAVANCEEPAHVPASKTRASAHKQLFVRSLAPTVTTEDLTEYFSENFPIKHALVVLDKETKESKQYGFVTFADAEDAQRAKEELDGSALKGKKIKIEIAESRHRDTEGDVPGAAGLSAGAKAKAEREQQKKDSQTPKLIVRNLPWSIKTPEELQKLFRSYGKCHFVKLPKLPSGELRGFGFVALRGKKNAEKAMAQLNGKEIDGRQIAVDWAVDKETWQDLQKKPEADEDGAGDDDSDAVSSVVSSDSEDDDADSDKDEEDEDESNTDYEAISEGDEEGGVQIEEDKPKLPEYTVFIRNLPFTADDDSLFEHFQQFGSIGYARVVLDRETERPKGTGFVRFVKEEDMINCLKGVPRVRLTTNTTARRDGTAISTTHSVLEDQDADPTGKYTMDGRILQISQAVDRSEATRLTAESAASRFARDKDKRRLYLLSEGTIDSKSALYQTLSPSEIKMREESATLRRKQIQENPSLHLSLTRLSIRNIPRTTTSKDLKALARKAVVGFAADVKANKRERLSKEEIARGGIEMMNAERARKAKGKGIVKQAKVVFETPAGSKIDEETSAAGAGRSRGYGFVEYYTHRSALMALRWLNGHAVEYKVKGEQPKSKKAAIEAMQDRKKRLIVEFAIENANVVARRSDRETKARDPGPINGNTSAGENEGTAGKKASATRDPDRRSNQSKKRKHESSDDVRVSTSGKQGSGAEGGKARVNHASGAAAGQVRLKRRVGIIQKKREARRARRKEKA
jgi:nucleolar protein 4